MKCHWKQVAVGAVAVAALTVGLFVRGGGGSHVLLPDAHLTPGDVLTQDTQTICQPGYTATVRNVSDSEKQAVFDEYHIKSRAPGQYEVDHLIPLELGGSNDIRNLWPQPAKPTPGFHEKDRLENRAHALVCSGQYEIAAAQQKIAKNWYAFAKELKVLP